MEDLLGTCRKVNVASLYHTYMAISKAMSSELEPHPPLEDQGSSKLPKGARVRLETRNRWTEFKSTRALRTGSTGRHEMR